MTSCGAQQRADRLRRLWGEASRGVMLALGGGHGRKWTKWRAAEKDKVGATAAVEGNLALAVGNAVAGIWRVSYAW